jgi:hypothetical protein
MVNASSFYCTTARGSVRPSAVRLTTCSEIALLTTFGLTMMLLPNAPRSSIVPSNGCVLVPDKSCATTESRLDTSGDTAGGPGDSCILHADRARRLVVAVQMHVVAWYLGLHPFGATDLVARGDDRDRAVIAGHVLQQERLRTERHSDLVPHHTLSRCRHPAVHRVAGIQLSGEQAPPATSDTTMTAITTIDRGPRRLMRRGLGPVGVGPPGGGPYPGWPGGGK